MPSERSRALDFDDNPPPRHRRRSPSPTTYHRRSPSPTPYRQRSPSPTYHRRSRTPPSPVRSERRERTRSPDPYSRQRDTNARGSPDYDRGNERSRARLTPERALDDRRPPPREDNRQDNRNGPSGYQGYGRDQRNGYAQGGRDDFFDSRRLQRENAKVSFWPASPSRPYKEDHKKESREKDKKHKSSKSKSKSTYKSKSKSSRARAKYSDEEDDEDHSDDDHRRRKSGSKRKHRSSHHDKHSSNKRRPASSPDSMSSTDDDRSGADEAKVEEEEAVWEEKQVSHAVAPRKENIKGPSLPAPPVPDAVDPVDDGSDSDPTEVGPMPYNPVTGKAMDPKEFGRALRPGEGSAMAAFIEAGERIPRRGEIGLKGPQIEKFEQAGYVMSGSRHRRMNAVRIRKENQVISAEEKRGILKMQAEEKAKREGQIISSFRELVDTKLQETS